MKRPEYERRLHKALAQASWLEGELTTTQSLLKRLELLQDIKHELAIASSTVVAAINEVQDHEVGMP